MPSSLLQWNVIGKYRRNALEGEPRVDAMSIKSRWFYTVTQSEQHQFSEICMWQ